jgi:predicted dehydrogenase
VLSVAIIGAGRIGQIRAGVIRGSDRARLVAVADIVHARGEKLAEGSSAQVYSDWTQVVRRNDIDAIVVSTPTKFHVDVTVAALKAGKHVLCEKPLGRTVYEARRMFEAARASDRVLKTGFNYRHMGHVRKAKELLQAGVLGPLHFLRCRYGHGGRPGYENEWCTNAELSGGGVFLEQGIHIFDLVRHLLGEPAQLLAQTRRFYWDFPVVEDNGFCILETVGGQVAQIHVSWTQWVNLFELELFGSEGYLRLEGRDGHYGPQRLTFGKRKPDHSRPAEELFEFVAPDDSWNREWQEFHAAIEEAREPMGSANDGLRAQQLIEAAYQSASRQSWVLIPGSENQPQEANR